MWTVLVVTILTTPLLGPPLPQPRYEQVGSYQTQSECLIAERYINQQQSRELYTQLYSQTMTYRRNTQCIRAY